MKKSVTPEYLVCLEDGKKLKMLKRHLKTAYNMTPEQYRERWNLRVYDPPPPPGPPRLLSTRGVAKAAFISSTRDQARL